MEGGANIREAGVELVPVNPRSVIAVEPEHRVAAAWRELAMEELSRTDSVCSADKPTFALRIG